MNIALIWYLYIKQNVISFVWHEEGQIGSQTQGFFSWPIFMKSHQKLVILVTTEKIHFIGRNIPVFIKFLKFKDFGWNMVKFKNSFDNYQAGLWPTSLKKVKPVPTGIVLQARRKTFASVTSWYFSSFLFHDYMTIRCNFFWFFQTELCHYTAPSFSLNYVPFFIGHIYFTRRTRRYT
jgi:hypothetical protein